MPLETTSDEEVDWDGAKGCWYFWDEDIQRYYVWNDTSEDWEIASQSYAPYVPPEDIPQLTEPPRPPPSDPSASPRSPRPGPTFKKLQDYTRMWLYRLERGVQTEKVASNFKRYRRKIFVNAKPQYFGLESYKNFLQEPQYHLSMISSVVIGRVGGRFKAAEAHWLEQGKEM